MSDSTETYTITAFSVSDGTLLFFFLNFITKYHLRNTVLVFFPLVLSFLPPGAKHIFLRNTITVGFPKKMHISPDVKP